jgi:hypothetical protein
MLLQVQLQVLMRSKLGVLQRHSQRVQYRLSIAVGILHSVWICTLAFCVLTYALLLCVLCHYSMATALAYMHHEADRDYAYIFRDLKPENCK